jgi:hypothetical protein
MQDTPPDRRQTRPRPPRAIPRRAESEATVARNPDAHYASADGRVLIFRIHGDLPRMLAIDGRQGDHDLTEERGDFDPHTRHPNRPPDGPDPQPLRELLRQYIEDLDWSPRLRRPSSNGNHPDGTTSTGRDHG